jgi:hypothetical protein
MCAHVDSPIARPCSFRTPYCASRSACVDATSSTEATYRDASEALASSSAAFGSDASSDAALQARPRSSVTSIGYSPRYSYRRRFASPSCSRAGTLPMRKSHDLQSALCVTAGDPSTVAPAPNAMDVHLADAVVASAARAVRRSMVSCFGAGA